MDNTGVYTMRINLHDIHGVKKFIHIAMEIESDIDLAIDRYVIDGKSLLGIMSLSVDRDLTLRMYEKVHGEFAKMKELMRENGFLVE